VKIMPKGIRWNSENFLLIRHILDSLGDPRIHKVDCMCSAQSWKTVTMQAALCYWLSEDNGPTLFVTSSKEKSREEMKERLKPMFNECPKVAEKMPQTRGLNTGKDIYFPGGVFRVTGCESEADLQSTPYQRLILDEGRSYPKGAMSMVAKRTRSFPHSFKQVRISTPDMENDEVHLGYQEGDMRVWEFQCRNPECGHYQELRWGEPGVKGGVKYDTNETTKPDGKWRYDELYKTLRYDCEKCGMEYRNLGPWGSDRIWFSTQGRVRRQNEDAPEDHHSYAWNALLPPNTDWRDQLHEKLEATAALAFGNTEKLKSWVNETNGKPWSDKMRYADDERALLKRCAEYDPLAPWLEEVRRFMTVDVQGAGGRHFWVVVRAWSYGGWSRLLWAGKAWTYAELDELAVKWDVSPGRVVIDTGKWAGEIYAQIMSRGYTWKAAKGEDKASFLVDDGGEKVRRMWKTTLVDPMLGKARPGFRARPIELYLFSRPATVSMLLESQAGAVGLWQVPPKRELTLDYRQQVTAYEIKMEMDSRGVPVAQIRTKRDNHLADCERMQFLAADVTGMLAGEAPPAQGTLDVSAFDE
jgi:hypothetical protein